MSPLRHTSIAAAILLWSAALVSAQTAADPSGHWQGSLQIPGAVVTFEVDLSKGSDGEFTGTTVQAAKGIKGLPLRSVAVAGAAITFDARRDQQFRGVMSS